GKNGPSVCAGVRTSSSANNPGTVKKLGTANAAAPRAVVPRKTRREGGGRGADMGRLLGWEALAATEAQSAPESAIHKNKVYALSRRLHTSCRACSCPDVRAVRSPASSEKPGSFDVFPSRDVW